MLSQQTWEGVVSVCRAWLRRYGNREEEEEGEEEMGEFSSGNDRNIIRVLNIEWLLKNRYDVMLGCMYM